MIYGFIIALFIPIKAMSPSTKQQKASSHQEHTFSFLILPHKKAVPIFTNSHQSVLCLILRITPHKLLFAMVGQREYTKKIVLNIWIDVVDV